MSTLRMKFRGTASILLLSALAGGCSDPAGPDGEGRVSAALTDAPSASQLASGPAKAEGPQAASSFQGQMTGSAQVYIYSEAEGWVALGSPSNASVALQSASETTVHAQATVPAGSYTRVRLVLQGAAADIAAGADLGGLVLGASVSITMGGSDGRVEIEKSVQPFTVSASSSATIRFDMNTQAWVNQTTAQAKAASDTEIASATTAKVESE